MASEMDIREKTNPMERKIVSCGNFIVVNNFLPARLKIELAPNVLFRAPIPTLKDCNPDNTMTPRENRMKHVLIAGTIVVAICSFLFMQLSHSDREFNSYQSLKPTEVTQVQSTPINEASILATNSANDPPVPGGTVFGNRKVRVGDKVGYSVSDNNLIDIDGKSRNFNTPLVIFSGNSKGIASRSFGEKLVMPSNTYAYVYLEREVMTGNLSAPVSAVTYLDVKSSGKVVLPKGARLIGQCRRVNGNRIEMSFDGVITADGREYSVEGIALGDDNLTGVAGLVNRNLPKKTGNLLASALLDSASQTMNITGDSFGTIFAGNMADQTSNSFDNVIDESTTRSGATIKIPANSRFKVLF